jgi:YD repeat-containing protein
VPWTPSPIEVDWNPGQSCRKAQTTEVDQPSGKTNSVTRYEWDGETLTVISKKLATDHGTEQRYRFDAKGRAIFHQSLDWQGGIAFTIERSYDEDGRPLQERHSWPNGFRLTEQEFVGKHLVGRWVSDSSGSTSNYRWSYDQAGRLSEARGEWSSGGKLSVSMARWTYDSRGMPSAVRREQDGSVGISTWTWRDTSHLERRTVDLHGLTGAMDLDTYGARAEIQIFDLPWVEAGNSSEAQDCVYPPSAITDGYAGPEYELAWARDILPMPEGIYTASSPYAELYLYYSYYYVPPRWATHSLIGQLWISLGSGPPALRSVIDYDESGEMVAESLRALGVDGAERQELMWRKRTYLGGQMGKDLVAVNLDPPEKRIDRELRFGRDAAGRLISRELYQGEQRLAYQTWAYDAAGRAVEHRVFLPHSFDGQPLINDTPAEFVLLERGRVSRNYDPLGRLVSEVISRGQGDAGESQRQYNYRTDGIRSVSYSASADDTQWITEYDEAGAVILAGRVAKSWGHWTWKDARTYDAAGLLHQRRVQTFDAAGEPEQDRLTTITYQCD